MQKVVKILEQHVQWVALALGLMYLGWMAYSYVVMPPVTVKLGTSGELYTPGTADKAIWESQGQPLESEINNKEEIHVKAKDMVGELYAKLKEENFKPITLATNWGNRQYRPEDGTVAPVDNGVKVAALPTLPAPQFVAESHAITTILMPPAPPAADAAAPAPGAVPPAPIRRDINYVALGYKVNSAALAAEFNKTLGAPKIPALLQTMFLTVDLYRQEQDPANAGKWGPPVLISSLPIYEMMKFPGDQVPPNPQGQVPFFSFEEWASQNQEMIARPAFYETAPDAPPWLFPGQAAPEAAPAGGAPAAAPARPFDPARDAPRTPAEQKQWTDYHKAMQPRGVGRPGAPYPGAGRYRPGTYRPGTPGAPYPQGVGPTGVPSPSGVPYPVPPGPSQYRRPDGLPFAGAPNGSAGGFDPNLLTADIEILAHDVTVEEGKTYRYALQYRLSNPLFGFFNNGAPPAAPALMNTFALASPPVDPKNDKGWGKPITIEPRTKLWVTLINVYSGRATFDVFVWSDGRYHHQTVKDVVPGDPIGPSRWALVDVRSDMRSKTDSYVIVMDTKGNLLRRDAISDKASPDYEKLKALAGAAAAAH